MSLVDDGLITPEVGAWGKEKYRLVQTYAKIFTKAIKNKCKKRVYIDLFAGAGRSKIEKTKEIILSSAMLAMEIPDKFDKYIFCEQDEEKLNALQARVKREYPTIDVCYLNGDANSLVDDIKANIPGNRTDFVLSFCFVDPYKLDNLAFDTIKRLSEKRMDFLVLVPTFMDAHRNILNYAPPDNNNIEKFTGYADWRNSWSEADKKGVKFGHFVLDSFGKRMKSLGYIYLGTDKTVTIQHSDKNLQLYHLAFFSKDKLGEKLWQETKKYSSNQRELF